MLGVGPFANYYIARSFYLGANLQHYFIDYKDKYYDYKMNKEEQHYISEEVICRGLGLILICRSG
jgi:hypothetical protein